MAAKRLDASGHDLSHPYLSPLLGDFAPGFPPTIIPTGTRDLFLSNCVRMHNALRRLGNRSELLIEEAMPPVGFFGAPEDVALAADVKKFAARAWGGEFLRSEEHTSELQSLLLISYAAFCLNKKTNIRHAQYNNT